MAKQNQRVGNPSEQAVPWGAQGLALSETQVPVSGGAVLPEFSNQGEGILDPGNCHDVVSETPTWKPEGEQHSPFTEPPRKSPFAPKAKPVVVEEVKVFPLSENDPSWLELVKFCQKHGDNIIQARYPHPRGECIDTIYRGVTVFAHESTQVRHKVLGWINWQDAIYE